MNVEIKIKRLTFGILSNSYQAAGEPTLPAGASGEAVYGISCRSRFFHGEISDDNKNGECIIMYVPAPRKLKSGNYNIELRLGGEHISITDPSDTECTVQAQKIKADYLAGARKKSPAAKDMTLRQAMDAYIKSRDKIISPGTIRGYKKIRNLRFQSVMDKPLKDIKDWQAICNGEVGTAKIPGAKISSKTIKNAWGFVKSVLRYHNMPVPKITLPQVIEKDEPFIEPDDIPKFLKAAKGDLCEGHILLTLHGLRRSEVAKIVLETPEMIDIKRGTIRIEGAMVFDENEKLVSKPENKNTSSRRTVPIMIARLKEILEEGPLAPLSLNTIYKHINKVCRRAGIAPVGTQGLRRTFASLCYSEGLSERETMDLGGWSDANVMRKIYIKLAKKDRKKAIEKLTKFYDNADENADKSVDTLQSQGL